MKNTRKVFTRIGCLIALVVISFTVAFPVSTFASPDKKAWDDSAIVQVKDSLRQISEAATLWQKAGGCSDRECTNASSLAAAGKLAVPIKVPSGIGAASKTAPAYSTTGTRMGGCGPASSGAPRTLNPNLPFVSEEFCREYNNSVGLGSTIVKNCASGGDCTSGSTQPHEFTTVNSPTFCYRNNKIFVIVWMGTIVSETPCPTY